MKIFNLANTLKFILLGNLFEILVFNIYFA